MFGFKGWLMVVLVVRFCSEGRLDGFVVAKLRAGACKNWVSTWLLVGG